MMDLYTINNVNETPDQITGLSYRMRPNKKCFRTSNVEIFTSTFG